MAPNLTVRSSPLRTQAALERVQRLEAMLGPVRAALIGACERDDELKQLLLKRAGSKADALSKFVDGEQSLDDLLQVRRWTSELSGAVFVGEFGMRLLFSRWHKLFELLDASVTLFGVAVGLSRCHGMIKGSGAVASPIAVFCWRL